jgi:hypothetical protein
MKNTRTVTTIVAFIATFIFSAGLTRIIFPAPVVQYVYIDRPQYIEQSSNEIELFLLQDISNGESRMDRTSSLRDMNDEEYFAVFADSVMEYSDTSMSMNADNFPQDFQAAWHFHMKAWRNYAEFLAIQENAPAGKRMKKADFQKGESSLNAEINRTWFEVLRISRNYGADVR